MITDFVFLGEQSLLDYLFDFRMDMLNNFQHKVVTHTAWVH